MQILTSKRRLEEHFESVSFRIMWFFYKLYYIVPSAQDFLPIKIFSKYSLLPAYAKCDMNLGKIVPTYCPSEHGDPPFFV